MKFSEKWLRTWTDPDLSSEDLALELTMAGLEVETITPAAAEFSGVVVGKVVSVEPHPDADRLRVCQVDVAADKLLNIVCGASNVVANLKVAVAVVGAILPENFKIKKAKLRGIESCGMICSASELGLIKSSEGIMELPEDAPIGKDFRDYFELDDQVFELELTPNRGDCLSIAGIAREVTALTKCEFKEPAIDEISGVIGTILPIQIEAESACSHYTGRIIREINPDAQTPLWLQERLRLGGINTITPIVDVTNYVMLELGQPLHAFDLAKLNDSITVRYAKPKESITLLDGNELALDDKTLVIADSKEPVALAGVMGGAESGVTANTQDIFLESAFFDPIVIASCVQRYALHTDSSHRFERGVDPKLQLKALNRVTDLLLEIVGGKAGPVSEVVNDEFLSELKVIILRRDRIERILGMKIADKDVVGILQRLGMKTETVKDGWQVIVPSWRFDIAEEIDLIEELARVYGYEQVPVHKLAAELTAKPYSETKLSLQRIRSLLVDRDYHEVITYSFVDAKLQKLLNPEYEPIELQNPISQDLAVMRTNTWPGLVKTLLYNQNRQQSRIRLFETGLCFVKENNALRQYPVLGGVATGNCYPEQWGTSKQNVDFFTVKSDLETLFQLTGCANDIHFKTAKHPALHPGRCAAIYCSKKPLGYLGELSPQIKQQLELVENVYLFELDLALVSKARITKYQKISKFPAVHRDIAIVVDEAITAQQIVDAIFAKGGDILRNVKVFDVYQGEKIAVGKKSMALNLILQHASRTLVDDEIEELVQKIVQELEQKFKIVLRS